MQQSDRRSSEASSATESAIPSQERSIGGSPDADPVLELLVELDREADLTEAVAHLWGPNDCAPSSEEEVLGLTALQLRQILARYCETRGISLEQLRSRWPEPTELHAGRQSRQPQSMRELLQTAALLKATSDPRRPNSHDRQITCRVPYSLEERREKGQKLGFKPRSYRRF